MLNLTIHFVQKWHIKAPLLFGPGNPISSDSSDRNTKRRLEMETGLLFLHADMANLQVLSKKKLIS